MKLKGSRQKPFYGDGFRILCMIFAGYCLLLISSRSLNLALELKFPAESSESQLGFEKFQQVQDLRSASPPENSTANDQQTSCATVEEMGVGFTEESGREGLRVRRMIRNHFDLNGRRPYHWKGFCQTFPTVPIFWRTVMAVARKWEQGWKSWSLDSDPSTAHVGAARVRRLPPDQFCRQGFVLGKASEAGFGNEMYKILTAAALSVMLNRSLIIGQTRSKFPFEDYISYTNLSFTLAEVKHLWRKNDCAGQHRRHLIMRVDDFEKPAETNVLCSDWREWKHPIIWFQGTTDGVAAQFFLKNIHPGMREVASLFFGDPGILQSRPNAFGELMRVIISPSRAVEEAVNWVLKGGPDPDVTLHMRMRMNRSVRAAQAALNCIEKALHSYLNRTTRPRVALVSDTPTLIEDIEPSLKEFAEVLRFDYKMFKSNVSSGIMNGAQYQPLDFRAKDWGPAPRWVAFVDFFLASRAKHAVVSGAHRRVATTYAQLIAALAGARHLGDSSMDLSFSFFSSFQSNLLAQGLSNQVGWGHVWNRFAGPLSCRNQSHQCALTPLLPSAWWDATWQSPISRDIHRLQAYGVHLEDSGEVIEGHLLSYCKSKKETVKTVYIFPNCNNSKCA